MADYDGLTPGQVLADASVAEFIKSLGLGIAEAQKALDENSIDQIAEFIEPREGLDGNTLLDMGLSPAFYHYQHADITCSLNLSLKVEKDFSLGLNLNGSFNSTSSESDAQLRQAKLEITTESTGTLTVKEKAFPLTGDTHPKRMRNLQKALIDDSSTGIALALYHLDPSELEITSDAEPEKVHVAKNTVAFLAGGSNSGIIRLGTNADTDYVLNGSTTVNTTAQASLSGYGTHVKTLIDRAGYTTRLFAPDDDKAILSLEFETSSHIIDDDDLEAISGKLMTIALAIKANSFEVTIDGFADRQPFRPRRNSEALNQELGLKRADYLEQLLIANGAPANKITSQSAGETAAATAGDQPGDDNQIFRRATIKIKNSPHHWLFLDEGRPEFTGIQPDMRSDGSANNGFTFVYTPPGSLDLSGKKVTVKGTDFDFNGSPGGGHASGLPSAFAHNLSNAINADTNLGAIATSVGNITTVTNKSDKYNWTLATLDPREISLAGTDGITVTDPFPRPTTSGQTKPKTGNKTVAFGASLDVGYSRKFEMNITGNSSISARLVSIPAPPEFLATIKEFLKKEDGE